VSRIEETGPCLIVGCPNKARRRGMCRKCQKENPREAQAPSVEDLLAADRVKAKATGEITGLKAKYSQALKQIEALEKEIGAVDAIRNSVTTFKIEPKFKTGTSEATPVLVLSDWHIEERVGAEVGGLNEYSLAVARSRATNVFRSGLRLMRLLNQDVKISTVVLPLLGDFITGNIHGEENAEKNQLPPTEAIIFAQDILISGIEFLLEHTDYSFVVPCHSGNHARTTHTTRFGTENGHSLEYLMYLHLAAYFRKEPRVQIQVSQGMHSYVDVYGKTIRFQHGHAIKYGGGVGGIYIPVNKAIAQWSKARHADLDVFGHFHQMRDGGNFICNGSLIGYNSFALSIKADFEQPKQALFLMDKKRGRTCTWPVLVE
jgi:hypothetical protein